MKDYTILIHPIVTVALKHYRVDTMSQPPQEYNGRSMESKKNTL